MKWAAIGVLVSSSFLWAGSDLKRPQTLVITNVNVVDTRNGDIRPNMTVAIKDGLIAAVMKFAIIEVGPDVQVVNGNGGFLVPGLWDMKRHLKQEPADGRKALFEFDVANGVTGVRDIDSDEISVVPGAGDLRPEVEPAQPLWLQRTKPAEIPSGWRHTIEDMNEIRSSCCLRKSHSQAAAVDHGGRSPDRAPDEYSTEEARKVFTDLSDHATWVVPGLVAEEASTLNSDELSPKPEMKPSSMAVHPAASSPNQLLRDIELVKSMHRAGVQFLAGTGGDLEHLPRSTIAEELALLVKSGLTPLEALQSATINPALCMAKLDLYGVVEGAHTADLVLLDASPLKEIRNVAKVRAVVL
ncbi:MAG: amidohydrolase family protein, partial [Acidobacteria bacterium]|nr:amidohydrolase family protein [Acidobacteriota bacterium]